MGFGFIASSTFAPLSADAAYAPHRSVFLSRVFVDGMDVSDAAKLSELSNSRGYNLASDFRKRYTAWLNERRLKTVVVFRPIDD